MLVLRRAENESVVVIHDGQVVGRVVLVDLSGNRGRIGFDGFSGYQVHREEIWDRIRAENGELVETGRQRRERLRHERKAAGELAALFGEPEPEPEVPVEDTQTHRIEPTQADKDRAASIATRIRQSRDLRLARAEQPARGEAVPA